MRNDQNLSTEELEKLWAEDADRTLKEWSYRMVEMPSLIENPSPFMQYLVEQYRKNVGVGLSKNGNAIKLSNLENSTTAYENGKISISGWLKSARRPSIGSQDDPIWYEPRSKTDPEADAHRRNVISNWMKKFP